MGFYAKWKLNGNSSNLKEKHLNYVRRQFEMPKGSPSLHRLFLGPSSKSNCAKLLWPTNIVSFSFARSMCISVPFRAAVCGPNE